MNDCYIFSVGKPDLGAKSVELIHQFGYKAGLFLDTSVKTTVADKYDLVIDIDFATLPTELARLTSLRGNVAGLLATYENYILSRATLGKFFAIPTLSEASARYCTDKALMRQAFLDYNPTITPQFSTIQTINQALEFARTVGFPVIIKPTNLVKSLLVIRCNSEDELKKYVAYAQREVADLYTKYRIFDREPQLIIEEFIQGPMYSIAAFIDKEGEPFTCPGITELEAAQTRGVDDNYLYRRSLPAQLDKKLESELLQVAREGIAALELRSSPAHIELINGPEGVKLIEIGARVGGYRPRMYQKSYGLDLTALEIQTACDLLLDREANHVAYTAVFELFPATTGAFVQVSGTEELPIDRLEYYSEKATVGQRIGPAKDGYKAALVIIVSHPDRKEFDEMVRAIDTLSIEVTS